jgi:hypothetical protein
MDTTFITGIALNTYTSFIAAAIFPTNRSPHRQVPRVSKPQQQENLLLLFYCHMI